MLTILVAFTLLHCQQKQKDPPTQKSSEPIIYTPSEVEDLTNWAESDLEKVDTLIYKTPIKFIRTAKDKIFVRRKLDEKPMAVYDNWFDTGVAVVAEGDDWYKIAWEKHRFVYYALYVDKKEWRDELIKDPVNSESTEEPTPFNSPLDSFQIVSISREEYQRMEKSAIKHFDIPEKYIWKKAEDFTIRIKNKETFFRGYPSDTVGGEPRRVGETTLMGYSKTLDSYLIEYVWYQAEDHSFGLINKSTGRAMSFPSFPKFSPDKKVVMCLEHRPYGHDFGDLHFYKIINDTAKLFAVGELPVIPVDNVTFNYYYGFWGNDNWFYQAVVPRNAFWQRELHKKGKFVREDIDPNYNFKYIKIRVKGSNIDQAR
jgi:hypothetical protein